MQKYGLMANVEESAIHSPACLVCDDPHPSYQWTDYSGEGVCRKCGTSYQLKWGKLEEGETYPRINVQVKWLPVLRRYFAETGQQNGCGTVMSARDYPEIAEGAEQFSTWWRAHESEYPELAKSA